MNALIDAAFSRSRVVVMALVMILAVGAFAYVTIPKESSPEIPIPTLYVSTGLDGISPEDAERLLAEPLETELSSITGLKQMTSNAGEGYASVQLEFEPGFDSVEALDKVREAVDRASSDLPDDAFDPVVTEINTALFPILTAILSGPVPERTLNGIAEDLQDAIEGLPGVLEVDVGGARTELLEVLIDPTVFETYDLSFEELIGQINRNNRLIAAGAIENGAGRIVLKVPGLIEDVADVMALPVKVRGDTVVTFADVATIRRTFEDPTGFARIDGQPALALEIKKRSGSNIIETVAAVRALIEATQAEWPDTVAVTYMQDESEQVQTMLSDLEANVIAAVILVMIVIVWALGIRSALLVGLAIPGAFLAGVTALLLMGYTMNLVVLFSLILVVGMLVDGAIVTTELADRRLQEGGEPKAAYAYAAKRMAWPIIASTATTLSVFFPLLFWSGTVGEFMKFLPITVILTLTASLFMALVFIPVVGGIIGKKPPQTAADKATLHAAEKGDPRDLKGFTGGYVRVLQFAILRPWATLIMAVAFLLRGIRRLRPVRQRHQLLPLGRAGLRAGAGPRPRQLLDLREGRAGAPGRGASVRLRGDQIRLRPLGRVQPGRADLIGTIQIELTEWDTRRTAAEIGEDIRADMATIPGIDVQVQTASNGPSAGKPVSLRVRARDTVEQADAVQAIRDAMDEIGGFTDVTDTRPLPGVEWRISVNRSEAARFGADISTLGQAVQLLTRGITVADYRPDDADGSVDINVRFPANERTLEELQSLRVPTSAGLVPISNFVTFEPSPRSGTITRVDQSRVISIEANVAPGVLVNDQIVALQAAIDGMDLPRGWRRPSRARRRTRRTR